MIKNKQNLFALVLGLLINFSILAHLAHDVWAATMVYFIVLLLGVVFILTSAWDEQVSGINGGILVVLLGVLAAFSVSFRSAINPQESLSEFMDVMAAMILLVISSHSLRSPQSRQIFLGTVLILFPIELIWHLFDRLQTDRVATYGSLLNANLSAGFHLLWVPLLLSPLIKTSWLRKGAAGCVFLTLLLTRSQSAWFCLLLMIPFMVGMKNIISFKKTNRALFYLVLTFIVAISLGWLVIKGVQLSSGRLWQSTYLYTNRMIWWQSGWAMFQDHPWFGIGLGNYPSAYLAYKVGEGQHTLYAHSFIVGLLAETGLIGFFSVVLLLGTWLFFFFRSSDRQDKFPVFLGLMAFFMFSLINLGTEYLGLILTVAIFMGMGISGYDGAFWKPRKSVAVIIAAGLLSLIPYVLMPFMSSQRVVSGFQEMESQQPTKKAEELFKEAIELDPRSWIAYQGLGQAYVKQFHQTGNIEDINRAIESQQKAISLNSLSGQLWWELAQYYQFLGDPSKAEQANKRAKTLNYKNLDT